MKKAVRFTQFGDPEVLEIVDLPDPHPGPGQVRIAVRGRRQRARDRHRQPGQPRVPALTGEEPSP